MLSFNEIAFIKMLANSMEELSLIRHSTSGYFL